MDKKLYCISAIFDKVDDITRAAKELTESEFKFFDIHTPYPVHGLSNKMKLKPSTLGYIALVLGLSGAALALLFMYYTKTLNYPQNIGGKPTFALPAFIPIAFEVTVLLASVGTVLAMLFIYFKFPNNSHPLQDTDFMKQVSLDKYGAIIEAKDPKFDESKVKEFFEKLGATKITPIYYDPEELGFKAKIFAPKFMLLLSIVAILTVGISYFLLNKWKQIPPRNWMWEQPRVNVQSKSTFFDDGFGMRTPVAGTVARGHQPYLFMGMNDSAALNLVNPVLLNEYNLRKGKEHYNTFCSPCHGYFGEGDSRLNNQFPNPPSLHSDKLRKWTDGQLYHVITNGQNIMPSYAPQLEPIERWQIVNYIRALQRALNAREEDFNE